MFLVDSHCHLNLLNVKEDPDWSLESVLRRAREYHVGFLLNVCVNLTDFPILLKQAEADAMIAATVGLHPNEKEDTTEAELMTLAKHPKVIGIGETGLDYFRSTGDLNWQRERFRTHIHVATQLKKPLIVHTRQAQEDTLTILREEQATSGIIHCFTEDWAMAKKALDLGFYISFSGIVTFKNAKAIQEAAQKVPLDRLLLETDAPYLAPEPHRGHPNEPAYVYHTAKFIAALRGITVEDLAEQTTHNFFTLFKGATKPHV